MRNTAKTRPAEAATRASYPPQPKRNVPDTSKSPSPGFVFFSFLQVKLWGPR